MDVIFGDSDLDRLETDAQFTGGFAQAIVRAYRRRMQQIRAATDERDLRSARLEKLKGRRSHQYSIRLNDQFRLILEMETASSVKTIIVISIEDYH